MSCWRGMGVVIAAEQRVWLAWRRSQSLIHECADSLADCNTVFNGLRIHRHCGKLHPGFNYHIRVRYRYPVVPRQKSKENTRASRHCRCVSLRAGWDRQGVGSGGGVECWSLHGAVHRTSVMVLSRPRPSNWCAASVAEHVDRRSRTLLSSWLHTVQY